jgi:PAS domain S-box-containing protein
MRKPTYKELETRIKELETKFQKEQKAGQDIREADMQCKFFMNTLPDIVYRLDKEGNIIQVNKAVEKYGYKIEEVQGSSIFEFVHPEDKEKVQYRVNERRTGDRATKDLEVRLFTKEGEEKIVETRAAVVTENFFSITAEGLYTSGKPAEESFSGTFGVARDITERKRIEEELHSELYKLKELTNGLDKIGVSIDIVDLDYNIVYQTEQLIETFGEAVGKRCYEVYMGLDRPCEQCPVEKAVESRSVQSIELKGKNEKFYHLFSVPFINPDGTIDKIIEIVQDITERKNAEKELLYFQKAVDGSSDAIGMSTPEGKHYYQNEAFDKLFGLSIQDVEGEAGPPSTIYADKKVGRDVFETVIRGDSWIGEVEMVNKDKQKLSVLSRAYSIKDENDNIIGIVGVHTDITERKQVEEELHKLASVVRHSSELVNLATLDGKMIFLNDAGSKMLGIDIEDVEKVNIIQVIPDHLQEMVQLELLPELMENHTWKGELQYLNLKTGTLTDVYALTYTITDPVTGAPLYMANVSLDITDRKKAEEALLEREAHLQAFFSNAAVGIALADTKGNFIKVNKHYLKMFGYENESDLFTMTVSSVIHPEDRLDTREAQQKLSKGEIDIYRGEKRYIRKDGSIFWGDISVSPIKRPNSDIAAFIAIIIDVTENKRSEKALRHSEARLQSVFNTMSEGVILIDPDGNIVQANSAAEHILGLKRSEIQGRNYVAPGWEVIRPDGTSMPPEEMAGPRAMKKKHSVKDVKMGVKKPSGYISWINVSASPLINEDGNLEGVVGTFADITESKNAEEEAKKLQEQLIQAQKMESIGRLAGGIAHDFNNILVSIMGHAELLKMKFNDLSSNEIQVVDVIIQGAVRAANLTKQLLGFARGGKYNPIPLNINTVIEDTVRVLEKIFEKTIKVEYDFENNANTIEADENQMNQVLTNIIINAKDAMPHGGKLIFKTENVYFDEEYTKINPEVKPGVYVKISITDTGTGMTKEVKNKIFEPFYSTKGKGTGLGLATVYGIVNNHGGHINVYSEPGKGTIFTLYFHVTDKEVKKKEKVAAVIKGEATILVVDDEEDVRDLTEEVLMELGYEVILAKNGKEAIRLYEEKKNEIDLVLLDMIMPEMAGRETNLRLRNINPDVRVLLSSGYSQNGTATEILNEGAMGFVQKPFKIQELSKVINDILKK